MGVQGPWVKKSPGKSKLLDETLKNYILEVGMKEKRPASQSLRERSESTQSLMFIYVHIRSGVKTTLICNQ